MLKGVAFVLLIVLLSWAYQATRPPPPKLCGSPAGPPVTGPRIKLRDGRHLAYKEYGVPKDKARYKIILVHGFSSCRHEAGVLTSVPQVLKLTYFLELQIQAYTHTCIYIDTNIVYVYFEGFYSWWIMFFLRTLLKN